METSRIARVFEEMGSLLEVKGENPFRCRAYHQAAQALEHLSGDLIEMIADGSLEKVPGIGEKMFTKVARLATSGTLPEYEALRASVPAGLLTVMRVPGLGPKKVKALYEELGIGSLGELRDAATAGKIAELKGFGKKTEAKILEGIAFIEKAGDRVLLSTARRLALPLLEFLRGHPGVERVALCGSLRRWRETIGDIDLLFSGADPERVLLDFVAHPSVVGVLGQGGTKASVRLQEGLQCDVRGVRDDQFATALNYFTGSKDHNVALRKRAIARGLKLSEYALEGEGGPLPVKTERDIYEALGLQEIPPELRENWGEIEVAEAGELPELIEEGSLTGTFHCHTDWSDGGNTLAEMVEAARNAGLHYLGIGDHSRLAGYAGGLSVERVREQWEAIDALNRELGGTFRVYKGTECDIRGDGTLDYPDEILAGFDYVVASVHSQFSMTRDEMTARIVRAVSNPYVTMLGHATGRLLLTRDGYPVDLERVIAAAAANGTWVEINANPHRLDVDDHHARLAHRAGVGVVINPDAHSTEGLGDLIYGIHVARRAGLRAGDVVNTRKPEEMERLLAQRRVKVRG